MRVTTAFCRWLRLDGVNVTAVEFSATLVVVSAELGPNAQHSWRRCHWISVPPT